ncbi:MAG: hypothetical protein BECKG1743F_GA0114225_102096 [Candidatus Kentron sp. G]|nr:MAG: hypothetical protein BECKG1743F_GA0114225_102096 [Candidatus Kentron sp. G]
MIGRHVARYTPRFWTLCALPATFGQSCYEIFNNKWGLATAGDFFTASKQMSAETVLLSGYFLFFVHVFGPLSLPRRGYIIQPRVALWPLPWVEGGH